MATYAEQHSRSTPLHLSVAPVLDGPHGRLALPVLLFLLAVVVPIQFYVGTLLFTGVRLFLLVMIAPLLWGLLRGKFGGFFLTDAFFLMHVVWMAIAMTVNNPDQAIAQAGSVGIEFLGGYLLGRAYIRNASEFLHIIRFLFLAIALSLPFAVYESATATPILLYLLERTPGISSYAPVYIEPRLGLDRAQVVFAHPIHYGLFCSVALSLSLISMEGIYNRVKRYSIALIICSCVFLSLSSGALLSVVIQGLLITWAWIFDRIPYRWLLLFAIGVLLYISIDLASDRTPVKVFLSYATFSTHTAYYRYLIFEWGMVNVWSNPIFGLGLNDWVRPDFMHSGSIDNFWLVMAMRYGIPGFVFVAAGYAVALSTIGLRNFENNRLLCQLRRGWMITFVGLTFTLCTVHVWTSVYAFVFFLFGAGMWMINADPKAETPAFGRCEKPLGFASESCKEASSSVARGLVKHSTDSSPRKVRYTRF